MKEPEYLEEKISESAEITIDIGDTYREKLKHLIKIFKFAYGQPTSDFKDVLDFNFFIRGVPNPDSVGKLEKIIMKFITAIRYFSYLGVDDEKINRQLGNFGITINKTDWTPVGGEKANRKKYMKAWSEMFPNDDPMVIDDNLLKFLLTIGVDLKQNILMLTTDIDAITEVVEQKCEISKSSFKKGVSLKATKLKGKDISEKVNKIELQADEVSSLIKMVE